MNEISAVKARLIGHEAKEYARQLVRKSNEAMVRSLKEQSNLVHIPSVDIGGDPLRWGLAVGVRYATLGLAKPGGGIPGWVAPPATGIWAKVAIGLGVGVLVGGGLLLASARRKRSRS